MANIFNAATLAEKLAKLNNSQQSIESIIFNYSSYFTKGRVSLLLTTHSHVLQTPTEHLKVNLMFNLNQFQVWMFFFSKKKKFQLWKYSVVV